KRGANVLNGASRYFSQSPSGSMVCRSLSITLNPFFAMLASRGRVSDAVQGIPSAGCPAAVAVAIMASAMYLPAHFKEDRLSVLRQLIRDHPLATLVTLGPDGLVANHIPMEIEPGGALGVLRGHVARANPVWRDSQASVEALAIFQAAQGYVTPAWYRTK